MSPASSNTHRVHNSPEFLELFNILKIPLFLCGIFHINVELINITFRPSIFQIYYYYSVLKIWNLDLSQHCEPCASERPGFYTLWPTVYQPWNQPKKFQDIFKHKSWNNYETSLHVDLALALCIFRRFRISKIKCSTVFIYYVTRLNSAGCKLYYIFLE